MVRWVVGSFLHGVDPLSYFSFQLLLYDWCKKDRGMYYPVCWMMFIKEPLVLNGKSSPCGGSGFPLSLSEWSFIIEYFMSGFRIAVEGRKEVFHLTMHSTHCIYCYMASDIW